MRIVTFKSSQESFAQALEQAGVEYSKIIQFSTTPMAAGLTLEVMQTIGSAVPWAALAAVAVKWIGARHGREIQITKRDGTVVSGKNLSSDEFEQVLAQAEWAVVIDTNKDA